MKFTTSFWITLAIMIFLFIMPTILTFGAPAYDGSQVYGFPLSFYSWGGKCYSPDGGILCTSFSYTNLIIDILFLIGIPFIVNFISLKVKK